MLLLIATMVVTTLLAVPPAGADPEGPVRLISQTPEEGPSDRQSSAPAISADGRYLTYVSQASNLTDDPKVGGATASNIYTYDRMTGQTWLVSRNADGTATGAGSSTSPVMTPDGRYIAYSSRAPDLVMGQGPPNNDLDVFVWDRTDRSTQLISRATGGGMCAAGLAGSLVPSISDDGRYVAFQSDCTDLVSPPVGNTHADVYLWDRTGPTVTNLTPALGGGASNGFSQNPRINGAGTRVVMQSAASNLSPVADTNGAPDVYLRLIGGGITPISTTPGGTDTGNGASGDAHISADGRYIAYETFATDLTGDTYPGVTPQNIMVFDSMATPPSNTLVSRSVTAMGQAGNGGSNAPRISADGSTIAYRTAATDTAPGADPGGFSQIIMWERASPTAVRASRTPMGGAGNGTSNLSFTTFNPQKMSTDGRYLVFQSQADNLVAGVSGTTDNIYLFDRVGASVRLLSQMAGGMGGGDQSSTQPVISPDGSSVAWASDATNLRDPLVTNGHRDVYAILGALEVDPPPDTPMLSIADAAVTRGPTGPNDIAFPVTLSPASAGTVSVAYTTTDQTALAGEDYEQTSGTLTFMPGQMTATITVPLLPAPAGPSRSFLVTLSNPTGDAMLQRETAVGTIADEGIEEPPPPPIVGDERVGVSDTVRIYRDDDPNAVGDVALRYSRATFGPDAPFPAPTSVLLATNGQFADALAAGARQTTRDEAGMRSGGRPLLLTDTDMLSPAVVEEMERLGATEVQILGGVAAVSQAVEDDLVNRGYMVQRYAGPTRLETATDLAARAFPSATTAILARAFPAMEATDPTQAFADSLAAGAWAAARGWPLVLTQSEVLSDSTRAYLQASMITTVWVVGGEAAINETVLAQLRELGLTVERVAGPTRFDTALAIAAQRGYVNQTQAPRAMLIDGQGPEAWAAGFAAAAYSALYDAPVLLATADVIPDTTGAWLTPMMVPDCPPEGCPPPGPVGPSEGESPSGPSEGGGPSDGPGPSGFQIDVDDITGPVLVCAIAGERCTQGRRLVGLPDLIELTLDEQGMTVARGSTLRAQIRNLEEGVRIRPTAGCLGDIDAVDVPSAPAPTELTIQVPDDAREGPCDITYIVTFPNGSLQTLVTPINVAAGLPGG